MNLDLIDRYEECHEKLIWLRESGFLHEDAEEKLFVELDLLWERMSPEELAEIEARFKRIPKTGEGLSGIVDCPLNEGIPRRRAA